MRCPRIPAASISLALRVLSALLFAAVLTAPPAAAQQQLTEDQSFLSTTQPGSVSWSIAVDGDVLVAGAPQNDQDGASAGTAIVYRRDAAGVWSQEQELLRPLGGTHGRLFAHGVAVDGDTIAIGEGTNTRVWFFRWDAAYDPSDPNNAALYGSNAPGRGPGTTGAWVADINTDFVDSVGPTFWTSFIALSGDLAAAADQRQDAVQLFRRQAGGDWAFEAQIDTPLQPGAVGFGHSIALQGDYLLVGAWNHDQGEVDTGGAYVFRHDGTSWGPGVSLLWPSGPDSTRAGDQFGSAVAMSLDGSGRPVALVGAGGVDKSGVVDVTNGDEGAGYVFYRDDTTGAWVLEAELVGFDAAKSFYTGGYRDTNVPSNTYSAVDIDGDLAVLGAFGGHPVGSGYGHGSVYAFQRTPSGWVSCNRLSASDGGSFQFLGHAVGASDGESLAAAETSANTKIYSFSDPCFVAPPPPPPPPRPACVKPNAPIHWWTGDGSGEDIAGSSPASLANGIGFEPGLVSEAFSLDGADDYADAGNAASLHVSGGDFTVECWVRFDTLGGDQSIVDKMSPGGPNGDGWRLIKQGDNRFWFCVGAGGNGCGNSTYTLFSQTVVQAGVWYHVAATKDDASGTMQLYVDGVLEDTRNTPTFVDSHSANLRIGNNVAEGAHLNGSIDEVSLYDWALSDTEIGALFVGCPLLDGDPPIVFIDDREDGDVIATDTVAMDVTVSDAAATTVSSSPAGVSGQTPPGGGTVNGTVPLDSEGDNLISVTATDEFGNVGGTSLTLVRDTTDPAVDVLSPGEGSVLGATPATFNVQVTDLTATTSAFGANSESLPAGGGTSSGPVDLVPGANAVSVTVTDAAGNVTTAVRNVFLDLTAPLVTIDSPADGACFGPGESPLAVVATVSDLTQTTVASTPAGVSGSLPAGGGSATGAVALVEGSNTISVSATDQTARTSSDSIVVVLDTKAPALSVDSPAAGAAVRGTIDFDATAIDLAPGSGVALVELLVDGGVVDSLTQAPFESSLDTTVIVDGLHTLEARATDGKGNVATSTIQALVDNTDPALTIDTPLDGALVSGTIAFDATASDGGSGAAWLDQLAAGQAPYPVDGSTAFAPPVTDGGASSQVDTALFADGPLVLAAEAQDDAGNWVATSVTVQVDNQAPNKSLIAPADGAVVSGILDIVADAQDPNLALLEIQVDGISVGSSSLPPLTVPFDTTTRVDGPMLITVVATDSLGNTSDCTATVTVDNVSSGTCNLHPETLNLKSKGKQKSVTLKVEGSSLGLLMPTEEHAWELRVPGGSPVPSTHGFSGDDVLSGGNGSGLPGLTIKFDRQLLIASIQAGIAAGMIQSNSEIVVEVYADGAKVCEDTLRIIH